MEDILPNKPPIDLPVWDQTSFLIVLGVGLLLVGMLYLILNPRKDQNLEDKVDPIDPLLEECLWCEALIEAGEHAAALTKLESLARQFLAREYEAELDHQSEREVIIFLREQEEDWTHFEVFFAHLEPVKFAGKDPEPAIIQAFQQAFKSHFS